MKLKQCCYTYELMNQLPSSLMSVPSAGGYNLLLAQQEGYPGTEGEALGLLSTRTASGSCGTGTFCQVS